MEEIDEYKIIDIYNNSTSRFECLKEFIKLIINDILNSIYEEDYNKFNELYIFIKDKIINLDKDDINNDNKELINKYTILKNIIEDIFNLKNININLTYLLEILKIE